MRAPADCGASAAGCSGNSLELEQGLVAAIDPCESLATVMTDLGSLTWCQSGNSLKIIE